MRLRLVGLEGAREGVDAGGDGLVGRQSFPVPASRPSARAPPARRRRAAPPRSFRLRRSSASGATTRSTRPQRSAVSASMISPSINNSRARPKPISRGMSAASTTEGMPTLTSGMPNFARVRGDAQVAGHRDFEPGAERVAVDARDHRHRQPAQAIAGRCTSVMKSRALARSSAAISGMLAPPMKALSPAPVSTSARKSSRAAKRLDRGDESRHQRAVERVELGAVVDGEIGDGAVARVLEPHVDAARAHVLP